MKNSTAKMSTTGFKSTVGGTKPKFSTSTKPTGMKLNAGESERLLEDTKQMEK